MRSVSRRKLLNLHCNMDLSSFKRCVLDQIIIYYPQCVIEELKSNNENVVLRLPMQNEDDARTFKDKLSSILHLNWIVYQTKSKFERVIFSKIWLCQHGRKNKLRGTHTRRNAECKAKLKITIKKVTKSTIRVDKFLAHDPPLAAEVKLDLNHCHNTASAEALRMLRVNEEVKDTFFEYFSNGLGPGEAIRCHENKFLCEEDYTSMANAAINPTRRQIDHLHNIWRETNLGSAVNPLEMLKSKLDLYKLNGAIIKISDREPWSVVMVTAVMLRVHLLDSSKEMVFVDSTCSCESTSTSITVFMTPTKVGALPLAVLIHPAQTSDSYVNAFRLLKDNFPLCFGGKADPQIIMTDDSSAEKAALKLIWPESVQLLCHFHVAQAEWRWLFSHTEEVRKDERPRLMKLFQAVMYAKSPEMLGKALDDLLKEEGKHPNFVERFKKFFQRKNEWILLYRQDLITRQNNTNNYAEATIRILKDIVLCRTKAFNVVALTDFCISMWEPYLIKKLLEYAHSRKNQVNLIYEKFLKKTENFAAEQLQEIDQNIFLFTTDAQNIYTINAEIGSCSCPSGTSGAFCKHQLFLMREKNIMFFNAPTISPSEKYELAVLALGEKCPSPNFFGSFIGSSSDIIQDSSNNFLNYKSEDACSYESIIPDVDAQKIASKEQREEIKRELSRLSNMLDNNMMQSTADKALRTLKELKCVNDFGKLYFFKFKSQKKIKVQAASIARRRPGVTKSGRRIPSGRPSQAINNKGIKRKRNLSGNINENRPNAKSHGANH